MSKMYRIVECGWQVLSCGTWIAPWAVPVEVSDCAAQERAPRYLWDGRNCIPCDADGTPIPRKTGGHLEALIEELKSEKERRDAARNTRQETARDPLAALLANLFR